MNHKSLKQANLQNISPIKNARQSLLKKQERCFVKEQFQNYLNLEQEKVQNDRFLQTDLNGAQNQQNSYYFQDLLNPNIEIQDNSQNYLFTQVRDNSLAQDMQSQIDIKQNTDSKISSFDSDSDTNSYQFQQDIKQMKKIHKRILLMKKNGKISSQKELKQILQFLQQFCKQLKNNTKIQADPSKNYPRDKNKYLFQILKKRYNQEILLILNELQEKEKNKKLQKINQIAKKGCWQKQLNNLLQINSFAFRKLILEVMESGEVQKMINQSRKDIKVKQLYQNLYKKDLQNFQKQVELKKQEKLIRRNTNENYFEDEFLSNEQFVCDVL